MTNSIRPIQFNNSFNNITDTCLTPDINCQRVYVSKFLAIGSNFINSSNIANKEVKNMSKYMTKYTAKCMSKYQSQLRIFGMIITIPMIFIAGINPALSLGLSRQLEMEKGRYDTGIFLFSITTNHHKNPNYLNADQIKVINQSTTEKQVIVESANFSQQSDGNIIEMFLTSGYYSKDCRRRKVCDD